MNVVSRAILFAKRTFFRSAIFRSHTLACACARSIAESGTCCSSGIRLQQHFCYSERVNALETLLTAESSSVRALAVSFYK